MNAAACQVSEGIRKGQKNIGELVAKTANKKAGRYVRLFIISFE